MTVGDAIRFVDTIKPNAFPDEAKIQWLSQLEGRVAAEVFLMAKPELEQFDYSKLTKTRAKARTLLVDPPHDDIYTEYLKAQIDHENGEYSKYQNTMQMFNERYNTFVAWFAGTYRPADGYYFPHLKEGGEDHGHV
jgi:hypothetical protein